MAGELKPCPFCGSEASKALLPDAPKERRRGVCCTVCEADVFGFSSYAEAVTAWNRRTPDAALTTSEG